MAGLIQHYKIDSSPEGVWSLLKDGERYLTGVTGSAPTQISDEWPEAGSTAQHSVGIGPARKSVLTIVRHSHAPRTLRMEIRAGWLGTLGLDLEVRPWGGAAFVTVQEYPLGPHRACTPSPSQRR
ncbi:SRPBCC family protein [Streptomyces sp. NPDC006265]|uniref:SRPBCC family protein n=1 Tax=Streptomyces sp. NPDC006265 TaxID=3156740 RepID=UPI00339DD364